MSIFDSTRNEDWLNLKSTRRHYVQAVPQWVTALAAGTDRSTVISLGLTVSRMLATVQSAKAVSAALQPLARDDLNDPTFDLLAFLTAAETSLKAVTTQIKTQFDNIGGVTHTLVLDVNGLVEYQAIQVGAGPTATLRTLLTASATALSP